jgi:hypothetical protein
MVARLEFIARGTPVSAVGRACQPLVRRETIMTRITATVVNGMLKPEQSLQLANDTRVRLTIEPLVERSEPRQAWEALNARLRQRPIHGLGRRPTRDELHERR